MAKKKTEPAVDPGPTAEYKVLHRLKHDGDNYLRGEYIELTEAEAKTLLSFGAIAKPKKAAPAPSAGPASGAQN